MANNFLCPDEEEDDAISFSNFPLVPDEHARDISEDFSTFQVLRSPAEQTDLFEFFCDLNSKMSHAEDIIYYGTLRPFGEQNQSPSISQTPKPSTTSTKNDHKVPENFLGRRSESLSEHKTSRSNSSKAHMRMRNSRSLDNQKFSRISSSGYSSARVSDGTTLKIPKPRWYMMFGSVKYPPEMDLNDIKSRQVCRTSSAPFFPSLEEVVEKAPVKRKSSWGVLNVLSCRDVASVHVTTSLASMPRV